MGNRPGFLKGVEGSPPASFKKPEIFTAKEAIMNRTVERQAKELGAGYDTTAVPSSQNSQIEEYISQLESVFCNVTDGSTAQVNWIQGFSYFLFTVQKPSSHRP